MRGGRELRGGPRIVLLGNTQRVEHSLAQRGVIQGALCAQGLKHGGARLHNAQEIIEVTRLQRRVLTVVREREELCGLPGESRSEQLPEHGE